MGIETVLIVFLVILAAIVAHGVSKARRARGANRQSGTNPQRKGNP
jgi:hypothetical protein